MAKSLRLILLLALIITPIVFYRSLNKKKSVNNTNMALPLIQAQAEFDKPKVALIFDDLGGNLNDLKKIYSLDIPLTISVIPNLRFSRNIAHIGARSGFSVLIDLPLAPSEEVEPNPKYKFISGDLGSWEINSLLRNYLNFIRIAIGVNSHMGSGATQDRELMKTVMEELKRRNLIFIDSRTSPESIAYELALREGLVCGYNEGSLDSSQSLDEIQQRLEGLIAIAKEKGKAIFIIHSNKEIINLIKNKLPALKEKVDFVTIRDYFEL